MHEMRTSKRLKLGFEGGFVGALDSLGLTDNAVYIFSPYKNLLSSYKGSAIKVQRDDLSSEWFEYKEDGTLDKVSILNFCGSGDGKVEEVSNPYDTNYNTKQTVSSSYRPRIVISGVFQEHGIKFDAIDDYLNVEKYSAINFTTFPFTVFVQAYTPATNNGYYFVINTDSGTNAQYSLYNLSGTINWKLNTTAVQTTYQQITDENYISVYRSGGTSAQAITTNASSTTGTYSASLTEYSFMNVGARSSAVDNSTHSVFYDGYIKTIIIFNTNIYTRYSELVEAI